MKVQPQVVLIAGAAAAGLFLAWKATRLVGDGAAAVVDAVQNGAVNPANPNNIVNRGVSAVGAQVSGDPDWTLGGQVWEWLNPEVNERILKGEPVPNAPATGPTTQKQTDWWNPSGWSFSGLFGG